LSFRARLCPIGDVGRPPRSQDLAAIAWHYSIAFIAIATPPPSGAKSLDRKAKHAAAAYEEPLNVGSANDVHDDYAEDDVGPMAVAVAGSAAEKRRHTERAAGGRSTAGARAGGGGDADDDEEPDAKKKRVVVFPRRAGLEADDKSQLFSQLQAGMKVRVHLGDLAG